MKVPTVPHHEIEAKLGGGQILRIKSHNARRNAKLYAPSLESLLSIKFSLYAQRHCADGFYIVSHQDAESLKRPHGRWARSILWPKRVPFDLAKRTGGIFG